MLIRDATAPVVDGVVAFRDHADETTHYYLPAVPEIATEPDGRPAFRATAFLAETSSTATDREATRCVLTFDVELPASTETLEKLRSEIEDRGLPVSRLVPAPLHGGSAFLDVSRPGAQDDAVDVYQGHAPTLLGTNRAVFAVAATGPEAQLLMAAVSVGNVPTVVRYSLEYLGLAPSFQATMRVRWKEVYHHLRELESTNFVFVSEEMDEVVESLEREQAVEVEILELDPEGASAATAALFTELKDQLVQKLFNPPRQSGDVPIEDRIGRGVRNVLVALMPGVSHTLRTLDQSQLGDATIDLREQRVNTYPANPQSTLSGLLARAGDVSDRVRWVSLDDLPLRTEEVILELAPGAGALGVRRVELNVVAELTGRREPLVDRTEVLVPADAPGATGGAGGERTVVHFRRQGAAEPVVQYQATVQLDPQLAASDSETWRLEPRPVVGGRVYFDAEEMLDVAWVRVELDDPSTLELGTRILVTVDATLTDSGEPLSRTELELTAEALSHRVTVVVPEGRDVGFRCRERFRRAGEDDFEREIATMERVHRVMNPYGQRWSIEIHARADWSRTQVLVAELRVWDVERQVWLRATQQLTAEAAAWSPVLAASRTTPQAAEVRLTRLPHDGPAVRGPWRDVHGVLVTVDDEVEALRRVRVRLKAPHWERVGARKAVVALEYAETQPPQSQELQLADDGATDDWTHDYPDPSRPDYTWSVRVLGWEGQRWNKPRAVSAADDLDVVLPDPLWR